MARLSDSIRVELDQLLEDGRRTIEGAGYSARQAITKVVQAELLPRAIVIVERLQVTGVEKKAAVLAWLGQFYDRVIQPMDAPGPDMLVDPILRAFLIEGASTLIDVLVAFLNSDQVQQLVTAFRSRAD